MTRRRVLLAVLVVVLAGAGAAAVRLTRPNMPEVTVERVRTRDLEAIVSASGKIQPKRQINLSATTIGRVTRLAVEEGQRVRAGQFLLEIDPRSLEGALQRGEASVAAARSALQQARTAVEQARTAVEQARVTLDLARQTLKRQQDLWSGGLTTREALERAQNEVELREVELKAREQEVQTREQEVQTRAQQIKQEEASLATTKYNLSQVIISSPMDGIVTRRNIEEGENVVVGTMNNAGTVLLTIADMSVIEAEVEVDETDVPEVTLGQQARVTIDAVPDRTFRGRVTEIGNSPIQQTASQQTTTTAQATNFKVVITLEEPVPDVRPGFTCTAEITTATRPNVLAVPIQALTVRELLYDAHGTLVREPPRPSRFRLFTRTPAPAPVPPEPPPGHERRETEGVFILRDSRAVFMPVKTGIAGERYFEVRSGLNEGDQVMTGPFSSIRELPDGAEVRLQESGR
ncbi:MAG: efflux RND transporter periplasmic adaptor subunit [Acidobacteria bacterium]|nr:efflux RND transporter periplasmic adaptor subunit [Acidobacteriota bacterium]